MCIDDLIEFYESELDYHTRKSAERLKCFAGSKPDHDSYMLGNHNAYEVAYQMALKQMIELKESLNERN